MLKLVWMHASLLLLGKEWARANEVVRVPHGVTTLAHMRLRGARRTEVFGVGSHEGMIDSQLKSCGGLVMMV